MIIINQNADIFIEKYKKFENLARTVYKIDDAESIPYELCKQKRFRNHEATIKYCQNIRNFLQHNPKYNGENIVYLNDPAIDMVDELIKIVENRPKCKDIAILDKNVYKRTKTDRVKEAMSAMRANVYTHVPIVNSDNIVEGVFDENSVFNYLAAEEIACIDDDLTFEQMKDYISLNNREMEEFIFVKASLYVDDLEKKFEEATGKGKRIGMAFITVSGKSDSPLVGIITPWDILGA